MLRYFITRTAGEQPAQYARRIGEFLDELEEQGVEWTETPTLRGCYLSVTSAPARPFAYLEYPK